ncbi:MAG: hypothetical protein IJE19_07400 [Clostridia bacterium]|nr:hypothetical protein [Clostridia bacterium]
MFADKINLTMSETLLVAVAGIAVVLLELAIIAILIVFLSKIIRALESKIGSSDKSSDAPAAAPATAPVPAAPVAAAPAPVAYASGRTQLIDVDEPTAAVVMALVSKESGIPLERLSFKSIRGITELVDVDERTAATIMAIISKESGIPLDRLSFKSIKKLED